MNRPRPVAGLLVLLILCALAACDDPSNVGLGLVGEEGGAPETATLPLGSATTVADDTLDDVTGAAPRVLAGAVLDPLVGRITADATIDVASTSTDDHEEVSAATLELTPNYVYGDTLAPVRLRLRDMPEDFDPADLTADTTLEAAAPIREFTFQPTDTLVTVDLPPSWVRDNSEVLLDTAFAENFHGFRLEAVSEEAVVGFAGTAALRVVADDDTLRFGGTSGNKTFTHIETDRSQATTTEGRLLLQDGTGLDVRFDISRGDMLEAFGGAAALNRSMLRFPVDEDPPRPASSFIRPAPEAVVLFGFTDAQPEGIAITRLTVTNGGVLEAADERLRSALQSLLAEETAFKSFRLQPASTGGTGAVINTLNLLALLDEDASQERRPRLVLTFTPLD